MTDYQRKTVSAVTLVASAGAAVTAMFIGSVFGTGSTLWGVAIGSIVSGSAAAWYENVIHRVRSRAPLKFRPKSWLKLNWKTALVVAGAGAASAAIVLVAAEYATGRTLHSDLTGKAQYGTTLGGWSTHPPSSPTSPVPASASAPSSSPVTTPPASSAPPSPSPDASPDASPSASPSTLATVTPSASPSAALVSSFPAAEPSSAPATP